MDDDRSALFEPPPDRFGLRGDALLWSALSRWLGDRPRPGSLSEFQQLLALGFRALTGHTLDECEPFFVAAFDRGGLSSGMIDPNFWRETAVPLLTRRFRARVERSD